MSDARFLVRRLRKLARLLDPASAVIFLLRWLAGGRVVPVKLRDLETELLVRRSDSDITVLWAVFGDKECDVELDPLPRFIVDGGAYVGYSSVYFASRYPGAQIIAVEPAGENYQLLLKNCEAYENIHILRGGLWSSGADLTVFNPGEKSWAFRVSAVSEPALDSVKGVTIPELLERYGVSEIDILKLDIEGAEEALFSGDCARWIPKVRAVVIEVHGEVCAAVVRRALFAENFTESQQGEKLVFMRPHEESEPTGGRASKAGCV